MIKRSVLLLFSGLTSVGASINSVNIQLFASDEFVQYEEGYIRGPGGLIDLTGLRFEVVSESFAQYLEEEQDYYGELDNAQDIFQEEEELQSYSEEQEALEYNEEQQEAVREYYEEKEDEQEKDVVEYYEEQHYEGNEEEYDEEKQEEAREYYEEDVEEEKEASIEYYEEQQEEAREYYEEHEEGKEEASIEYYEEQQEEAREYYEEHEEEEAPADYYEEQREEANEYYEEQNDEVQDFIEEGGYDRKLEQTFDGENQDTSIDIVIFPLRKGSNSARGINWAEHGIGKRSADGELRWCCNEEAVELGLCQQSSEEFGKLLVGDNFQHGAHLQLKVPHEGFMEQPTSVNGKVALDESATYIVLYANCNTMYGRSVEVTGQIVWKSKHGYLPGELYGFLIFYAVVTAVYIGLYIWFSMLRKQFKEYNIEIERWILLAITLGMAEMIFRTVEYHEWNHSGHRSSFYIWIGIMAGVLKQGISRCVMVMVSMGWGVIRDTLDDFMHKVVALGASYIIVSVVLNSMVLFAVNHINTMSYHGEAGLFDVVEILTYVRFFINVVFMAWIIKSLDNTISHLQGLKESRKLERMMQLRMVFVVFIGLSTMWTFFSFTDKHKEEGMIQEEHAWAKDAATELNYLLLLVCIAILWRPNANAQAYAFVQLGEDDSLMKVPSACDDFDDEESETEKSTERYSDREDDDLQLY